MCRDRFGQRGGVSTGTAVGDGPAVKSEREQRLDAAKILMTATEGGGGDCDGCEKGRVWAVDNEPWVMGNGDGE